MQSSPVLMIDFTYINPGFLNNYANLAQNGKKAGLLLVQFSTLCEERLETLWKRNLK